MKLVLILFTAALNFGFFFKATKLKNVFISHTHTYTHTFVRESVLKFKVLRFLPLIEK